MLLACKCGNTITKDLFKYKRMDYDHIDKNGSITKDKNKYHGKDYFIKKGTFLNFETYFIKSFYKNTKKKINPKRYPYEIRCYAVNKEDLINVNLSTSEEDKGCCDVYHGKIECNHCLSVLGFEESDCYQDKKCLLIKNYITIKYKT